jgi:hypothetical protein
VAEISKVIPQSVNISQFRKTNLQMKIDSYH